MASESLVNSKDIIVDDKDLEEPQASNSTKDTNTQLNSNTNLSNADKLKAKKLKANKPTQKEKLEILLPRKTTRFLSQFKRLDEEAEEYLHLTKDNFEDNQYILITNLENEPKSFIEAISSPNKEHWIRAMQEEYKELTSSNTWTLKDLPKGRVALGGRWVYKLKTNSKGDIIRYKARWVVQGYNQVLGLDYLETFSTTCRPECYRLVLLLAVNAGWHIAQYDVKNAFVHANIDSTIYVTQPRGFIQEGPSKFCLLNKALYGLKQSPRLWYKHLKQALLKEGFEVFPFDEGIFIHSTKGIIICCHVDDFIITGANKAVIEAFTKSLAKSIKITYLGEISTFLGNEIEINRIKKSIYIHQRRYTQKILAQYKKLGLRPVSTPFEAGVKLKKSTSQASKEEIKEYQQQIGSLLFLSLKTRPDLAFAVSKCSRFMSNPDKSHFKALDRIWQYLNTYPDLGILLDCSSEVFIKIYCDSDWASNLDDRRSTQAYISCIGSAPINWATKLQKTIACSSTEAEYMALKTATQESIYLLNMLKWLSDRKLVQLAKPFATILVDNLGAKDLSENPTHHERTKHIDIAFHFVRQTIESGITKVIHIPDKLQVADPLTKGVLKPKLDWFKETINLLSPSQIQSFYS